MLIKVNKAIKRLKIAYENYRINRRINIFRFSCERRTTKYRSK